MNTNITILYYILQNFSENIFRVHETSRMGKVQQRHTYRKIEHDLEVDFLIYRIPRTRRRFHFTSHFFMSRQNLKFQISQNSSRSHARPELGKKFSENYSRFILRGE